MSWRRTFFQHNRLLVVLADLQKHTLLPSRDPDLQDTNTIQPRPQKYTLECVGLLQAHVGPLQADGDSVQCNRLLVVLAVWHRLGRYSAHPYQSKLPMQEVQIDIVQIR